MEAQSYRFRKIAPACPTLRRRGDDMAPWEKDQLIRTKRKLFRTLLAIEAPEDLSEIEIHLMSLLGKDPDTQTMFKEKGR